MSHDYVMTFRGMTCMFIRVSSERVSSERKENSSCFARRNTGAVLQSLFRTLHFVHVRKGRISCCGCCWLCLACCGHRPLDWRLKILMSSRCTSADGGTKYSHGVECNGQGNSMHTQRDTAPDEQFQHPMSLQEVHLTRLYHAMWLCLASKLTEVADAVQEESARDG